MTNEEIAERVSRFLALVKKWTSQGKVAYWIGRDVPWKAEDLVAYLERASPEDLEEYRSIMAPVMRNNADAEAFKEHVERLIGESKV